jgi:flagellar hook protein FlgE
MLQALLSSVSGIKAQQSKMNAIGNNLANVNTTAFKGTRVNFADMMSQTTRGASSPTTSRGGIDAKQYGLGVYVASTDIVAEQGSLNQTNRASDLAVSGNGFFVVSDATQNTFTRDGGFEIDSTGVLVQRSSGLRVMGWQADVNGVVDPTVAILPTSQINIPVGNMAIVQTTTRANFAGNLDAGALPTANVDTQIRVYDSLGGAHDLTMRATGIVTPPAAPAPVGATSSWDWSIWEGPAGVGVPIATNATGGNERLYFDATGKPVTGLAAGIFNTVTVPASGAAAAFTVDLNTAPLTQLKGTSQLNAIDQNGFPSGTLQSYTISKDGVITGLFSNGMTRSLAQIATADFSNVQGLERIGENGFRNTANSGIPMIGAPSTGSRGSVNTGFLEASNVDIGNEFTDLIITQRGFQANTKVVTTVDEMLQELLNMKR